MTDADGGRTEAARRALSLVLLLGLVSLLADVCYEGMRSAVGPYLAALGASGTAVGLVGGTGELVGYGLRYLAGRAVGHSGRYWTFTFIGYGLTMAAVPLLAVAGSWQAVAALVAVERLGKAVRSPAKAAILSFASKDVGAGRAFGLHNALDQVGGISGPLLVTAIFAAGGGYRVAFVALGVAGAAALVPLAVARIRFPEPRALDDGPAPAAIETRRLVRYLIGVALAGAGLADWALLSFDLARRSSLDPVWIPALYAGAMAIDGVASLAFGVAFDRGRARGRSGAGLLAGALVVGAGFAPLVLLGHGAAAYVGIALWAATTAAIEAIAKAGVASLVPAAQRARAYGIYYAVFGVAWWLGSFALGATYDRSRTAAVVLASSLMVIGAAVLASEAFGSRGASRAAGADRAAPDGPAPENRSG